MAIKTFESAKHCAKIHQCEECGQWTYADRGPKWDKIVHSRRCSSTEQPATATKAAPKQSAIQSAAKAGTLHRDFTDEQIQDAIRNHEISLSDAMNQDM